MQMVVMVAGAVAEGAGWLVSTRRRGMVWRVMPVVLAVTGLGAVLARRPVWAGHEGSVSAVAVGLGSGLALYGATRAFVWIATWWEPFRMAVVGQYEEAAEVSLATSLGLSLVVMVPAEELFWRGLFQARLAAGGGIAAAAAFTWLSYTGANLPSRSSPIVAGAVVGGGVWALLAFWSGGILASLASHILWTGLMLAAPPGAGRWSGGST